MNRIVKKTQLSEDVFRLDVEVPLIAKKRKAGQFIILRVCEEGERIPLTIAGADPQAGTITLIFQAVGKTTKALSRLNEGEDICDLVGPLGKPTHIEKIGTVVCIGGGIGVAPVRPIAEAQGRAGNKVISIIGARTKDLLILEDDMGALSDELLVATDDGSCGIHGFVTQVLQQLIDRSEKIDLVVAIGPLPMMNAVCKLTKENDLPTVVSLNPIMVDGTGMCGCCRVEVGGKTKFACVDGPEFDGHKVDFAQLGRRLKSYIDQESTSREQYEHRCKLEDAE